MKIQPVTTGEFERVCSFKSPAQRNYFFVRGTDGLLRVVTGLCLAAPLEWLKERAVCYLSGYQLV